MIQKLNYLFLAFVFCFSLSAQSRYSNENSVFSSEEPVKIEEVVSWRAMGSQWAAGSNSAGEVIAIYDLSYPYHSFQKFLGELDPTGSGYQQLIDLVTQARNAWLSRSALHSDALSAEEIDRLHQVDEALLELQDLKAKMDDPKVAGQEIQSSAFWWKSVPWKSGDHGKGLQAPEHFFLSDINYKDLVVDYEEFEALLKQLDQVALEQFEFVKSSTGKYQIHWTSGKISKKSESSIATALSAPFKIADLRCTHCATHDGMSPSMRGAVVQLLALIPVPYISSMIGIALSELFLFQEELLYNHQEMLLEWVRSQEEIGSLSTHGVTESQRQLILQSVLHSRMSAQDAEGRSASDYLKEWTMQENGALQQAGMALQHLTQSGKNVTLLNPRFGIEKGENSKIKIYSLSASIYYNLFSTPVAYDSTSPTWIRNQRLAIEIGHILSQFSGIFIPNRTLAYVLASAFEWLLEVPMHRLQHWEARLTAHLLGLNAAGENWDLAISALLSQAINPLELSATERALVVEGRRKAFNVQPSN